MNRAAVYARYSSDMQSESSIEDQIDICQKKIAQEGYTFIQAYPDYAISGASTINRPSLNALMHDAEQGLFDIIVCEALDRLSRDLSDIAGIYKQLSFYNIKLITIAEGDITELHIGLKGTMNQLFLKDLAQKTKRGQMGALNAGRIPGGKSYGYKATAEKGVFIIDDDEAETVRYIFNEYVKGHSALTIARRLNNNNVPAPRGGYWNASTINGNPKRGNGIICNELYKGMLVFNRQSFAKNPKTGKRTARLNPENQWLRKEAPHMAIISEDIWNKANERRATPHKNPQQARRAKNIFSGLIKCACCGETMTVVNTKRYGCYGYKTKGICDNNKTLLIADVEKRVLESLKKNMLQPHLIKIFISEFHAELTRLQDRENSNKLKKQRYLQEIEKRLTGYYKAIEDGFYNPTIKESITKLENEKGKITFEINKKDNSKVINIHHKNASKLYQDKIDALYDSLHKEDEKVQAFEIIRSMIKKITATPKSDGYDLDISGLLAAALNFATQEKSVTVVAGARFELTTFRL